MMPAARYTIKMHNTSTTAYHVFKDVEKDAFDFFRVGSVLSRRLEGDRSHQPTPICHEQ